MPYKISYRPKLDYTKNYDTNGNIADVEKKITEEPVAINPNSSKLKDISTSFSNISYAIEMLPQDLSEAISTPIAGAKYIFDSITTNDYDPTFNDEDAIGIYDIPEETKPTTNTSDTTTTDTESSETSTTINVPDQFSIITDIIYNTKIPNPTDKFSNAYAVDIVDIINDYTLKVETSISDYAVKISHILKECPKATVKTLNSTYSKKTDTISDPGLWHVSDALIKSQILKDQKIRAYKKLFNIRKTVFNLKACKLASEMQKRYAETRYKEQSSLIALNSNLLLDESRLTYDKKYKENLKNLYKYLNSSVILINECLQMQVKEAQSKAMLINRGMI